MARYLEPARFKKLALGNWEMPCFSVVPRFFLLEDCSDFFEPPNIQIFLAICFLRPENATRVVSLSELVEAGSKKVFWECPASLLWLLLTGVFMKDEWRNKTGPLCRRSACCIAAGVQYGHKSNQPGSHMIRFRHFCHHFIPELNESVDTSFPSYSCALGWI